MSNDKTRNVPYVRKSSPVGVVPKNRTPLDASHDDMVQRTRCI